jgi:hypothetical protein
LVTALVLLLTALSSEGETSVAVNVGPGVVAVRFRRSF